MLYAIGLNEFNFVKIEYICAMKNDGSFQDCINSVTFNVPQSRITFYNNPSDAKQALAEINNNYENIEVLEYLFEDISEEKLKDLKIFELKAKILEE